MSPPHPPTPTAPQDPASSSFAGAGAASESGLSNTRFILALIVAMISDAISIAAQVALPMQWVLDGATALALFAILGRRWQLLPGLVAEAIPGVATLPTWVLVVLAIRMAQPRRRVEPDRRENVRVIENTRVG